MVRLLISNGIQVLVLVSANTSTKVLGIGIYQNKKRGIAQCKSAPTETPTIYFQIELYSHYDL